MIVVNPISFERVANRPHVGFAPRNLRPYLRLHEVGDRNGRQDGDDGHYNKQFDESETFVPYCSFSFLLKCSKIGGSRRPPQNPGTRAPRGLLNVPCITSCRDRVSHVGANQKTIEFMAARCQPFLSFIVVQRMFPPCFCVGC